MADLETRKQKFKERMDDAAQLGRAICEREVATSGINYGGQTKAHIDQEQITVKAQYMIRYLADLAIELARCHWTKAQKPASLFVELEEFLKEQGHPIAEFEE